MLVSICGNPLVSTERPWTQKDPESAFAVYLSPGTTPSPTRVRPNNSTAIQAVVTGKKVLAVITGKKVFLSTKFSASCFAGEGRRRAGISILGGYHPLALYFSVPANRVPHTGGPSLGMKAASVWYPVTPHLISLFWSKDEVPFVLNKDGDSALDQHNMQENSMCRVYT